MKLLVVNLKTITIAELISNQTLQLMIDNTKEKSLIGFLMGHGYIDENYHAYISFFHEGSLTQTDNEFVMSVIGMNQNAWDYHLVNISNVIDRLQLQYFDKSYILNFDLLTHLLVSNNVKWSEKRNSIGRLIAKLDSQSKKFIEEYIDQPNSKIETLFEIISKNNDDLWDIIETQDNLSASRKDKYLAILLDGCHDCLQQLNKSNFLKTYFSQMDHIFSFIDEYGNPDICINAIETLGIELKNLDSPKSADSLRVFDCIYVNNAYGLNINSLAVVLQAKLGQKFDKTNFDEQNYSYIKKSSLPELISYVDDNFAEYFNNCIIGQCKQNDDQEIIVMILNNVSIDLEIRIYYLLCQATPLVDLHLIPDNKVQNAIIKNDAMEKSWHNVFVCFISNSMTLTSEMATYLNNVDVYVTLGKEKISYTEEILTEENATTILPIIMKSEIITEAAVHELQKVSPFRWKTFGLETLQSTRIKTLMARRNFSLSLENYTALKTKLPNNHIKLIEQNSDIFLSSYIKLPIDNHDWCLILKSSLSNETKEAIIDCEYANFISNTSIIAIMHTIIESSFRKHWHIDILCACLPVMSEAIALKIGIFHLKSRNFNKVESANLIMSLPEPYSKLVQAGTRPTLSKNSASEYLLEYITNWNIISSIDGSNKDTIKITMKRFGTIK